jgi:hypothetical protein
LDTSKLVNEKIEYSIEYALITGGVLVDINADRDKDNKLGTGIDITDDFWWL